MEGNLLNQKEYLKKYLSSGITDEKKKKKKKKKQKHGPKTVKIIDDDIDLKNMRPIEDGEFDIFLDSEDAPQIAGIVDERGPVDFSDQRRWKIVTNEEEGIIFRSNEKARRHGNNLSNKYGSSPMNENPNNDPDSDLSPPRRSKPSHKDKRPGNNVSDKLVSSIINENPNDDPDSDLSPPRRSKSSHKGKRLRDNTCDKLASSTINENSHDDSNSDLSPPRKPITIKGMCTEKNESDSDLSPPRRPKDYDLVPIPLRKNKKHNDSSLHGNNDNYNADLSPLKKGTKHRKTSRDFSKENKCHGDDKASKQNMSHDNADDYHKAYRSSRDKDSGKQRYSGSWSNSTKNREFSDSDLSPPRRKERYNELDHNPRQESNGSTPPRSTKQERHSRNNDKHIYEKKLYKRTREYEESYANLAHKRSKYKDSHQHDKFERTSKYDEKCSRDDERMNYEKLDKSDKYRYEAGPSQKKDRPSRWNKVSEVEVVSHTETFNNGEDRMKKTLDGKTAGLQDAKALRKETEAHKKREAEHFSKMSKEISGIGQAAIVRDTKTGRKRNLEAEAAEELEKQKRQAELDEKYAKWGKGLKQVEDREEKLKNDLYEMSKPLARYADDVDLDKELREQEREGDPMLEYIKQKQIKEGKRKPERPRYEGSFMPNRFGVKPGHRWDGVDRSNGYEKKWFDAQNAKVARQEEAYKWSTSDM